MADIQAEVGKDKKKNNIYLSYKKIRTNIQIKQTVLYFQVQ